MMDEVEEEQAAAGTLSFSLLLEKSLPAQVDIAAWNPGKDLLAMVTKDHQLIVHRLNWQRLWAVSPDLKVTAICWRPDGKALAAGHKNGSIAIYDVENGDMVRRITPHKAPVECLHWAEEGQDILVDEDDFYYYEDRTPRFLPPPPKAPPMPGSTPSFDMSSVLGPSAEEHGCSNLRCIASTTPQQLNILCSGDRDGIICLSAFGVFPVGKLDMHKLMVSDVHSVPHMKSFYQLSNARVHQVSLSNDFRTMTAICSGTRTVENAPPGISDLPGLHCVSLDMSLLNRRRKEICQVSLQASSVEELLDVVQFSVAVMEKHWSDAFNSFHSKFQVYTDLLKEHGSGAKPRDELLILLICGYASPALHQFLASTLGEAGIKRLAKGIENASKELHNIIAEHLQPAAEMIAFRIGELRGFSRWKSRFSIVGLDETIMNEAMEHAGMVVVQVERLLRKLIETSGQYHVFFVWLTKALRHLDREALPQAEQLPNVDCKAVEHFLQKDFDKDPIGPHLSKSEDFSVEVPLELEEVMKDLVNAGGYSDALFLRRTLMQQVNQVCLRCQEAFSMPSKVVSPKLGLPSMLILCNIVNPTNFERIPMCLMYSEVKQTNAVLVAQEHESFLKEYLCFQRNVDSSSDDPNVVGILRGFGPPHERDIQGEANFNPEAVALHIDQKLRCIDLALYKQRQLVLLLSEREQNNQEGVGQTWLILLPLDDLPFVQLSRICTPAKSDLLQQCSSMGAVAVVGLEHGKVRALPQRDVLTPLAVSASRGLACVFTSQRQVLLYDLEEDEEVKDEEME